MEVRFMYSYGNISRNTIAMVLAGGKGERLSPITFGRPKPAVPFGGKYKIIDFVLSNMFNSGIKKVYILTQYQAYSLSKHIKESWAKWTGLGEFYDTISPETTSVGEQWYKGTADAIYQNLGFIESSGAEYVVIFGGDHIYKMDIAQMMAYHRMNKAELTIAVLEIPPEEASRFGVLCVDDDLRVKSFMEKPKDPSVPGRATASHQWAIIFFGKNSLMSLKGQAKVRRLDFGNTSSHDAQRKTTSAYSFFDNYVPGMEPNEQGYWKDIKHATPAMKRTWTWSWSAPVEPHNYDGRSDNQPAARKNRVRQRRPAERTSTPVRWLHHERRTVGGRSGPLQDPQLAGSRIPSLDNVDVGGNAKIGRPSSMRAFIFRRMEIGYDHERTA
jgi:NDP-sugar pyrophosphorylase family protein